MRVGDGGNAETSACKRFVRVELIGCTPYVVGVVPADSKVYRRKENGGSSLDIAAALLFGSLSDYGGYDIGNEPEYYQMEHHNYDRVEVDESEAGKSAEWYQAGEP